MTVRAKCRVKQRLQHLKQCLLNEAINDRRDAQFARAAVGFWNANTAHRFRDVAALPQLFPNFRPCRFQIFPDLENIQTIDTGRAFVRLHAPPCALHVPSRQHLLKQSQPCVRRFRLLGRCFIAGNLKRGFTAPCHFPLRLRGHLMPYNCHQSCV